MTPTTTNRAVLKPNQCFNVNQTPVLLVINTHMKNAHMKNLRKTTRRIFGYRSHDPM